MSTFRHHPDGWIYIDEKQIPLSLFLEQEPGYILPEPFIGREYVQGKAHFLYTKEAQKGGEFPWNLGDLYISRKASYLVQKEVIVEEPVLTRDELVEKEIVSKGVDLKSTIEALLRQVAFNDSTKLDQIKIIIAEAEQKFPEVIKP